MSFMKNKEIKKVRLYFYKNKLKKYYRFLDLCKRNPIHLHFKQYYEC